MTFSEALTVLKLGEKCAREGWNGRGMHVAIADPEADDFITVPFLYLETAQGERVPWLASQTDILADDWGTVG